MQARVTTVEGFGGAGLAVHRMGAGRPVLLFHGLFSSAEVNWIKYGHAAALAEAGFEAIMPDLRAHGLSDAPHDPAQYPPDVLVKDVEAIVANLGLVDYDLAGFSLGARTSLKGVIAGLRPRRLVLGGMGYEGLVHWRGRTAHFLDVIARYGTIPRDDPSYFAQQFMKTMQVDRVAAELLLHSIEGGGDYDFSAASMPALVVCGADDRDNGDPVRLARELPQGHFVEVPGTHMGCVSRPELGRAIVDFLSA